MNRTTLVVATIAGGLVLASGKAGAGAGLYDVNSALHSPHPFATPAERYTLPADALSYPNAPGPLYASPPLAPAPILPSGVLSYPNDPGLFGTPSPRVQPSRPVAQAPVPASAPVRPVQTPSRDRSPYGWLSEVRVGAMLHDQGPFSSHKEDGVDANLEILFRSPQFLDFLWSPRPVIGGHFHSDGDTHQAYAGLTWDWDIWGDDVFIEFNLGGAYHTGEEETGDPDRKELGCSVLFHLATDLGYRITENHAVMIHFSHISNADLCDSNEGLENVGIRYGYRF